MDLCRAVRQCSRPFGHRGQHGGFRRLVSRGDAVTPRQRQVLEGFARGLSYEAVAHELGISRHTVARHRTEIASRLGVPSPTSTIEILAAVGWLQVPA